MALTRLSNQSLTSVTALPTAISTGKIGQVVTHSLNTVQTISTTGSYQASGLTLNITPSASSSTIFLLATIQILARF